MYIRQFESQRKNFQLQSAADDGSIVTAKCEVVFQEQA